MNMTQAPDAAMSMGAVDPGPAAQAATPPPAAAPGLWHPSQGQAFDPRRKSPLLAAALSVMPGVGQIYIGYYVRGFAIAATFGLVVMTAATLNSESLSPLLGMSAMFLWVFNLIDAGRMAALYNHAAAGTDVLEMPEDFKLPKMGGSIIGGAILLGFGAIALSNTAFGFSLDWVENWWPIFPVAIGVYLFARGVMDFTASQSGGGSTSSMDDADSGIDD